MRTPKTSNFVSLFGGTQYVWRVAVTGSKKEFLAAQELRDQGLNVFLPYTREKVRVKLPTRRATFKVEVREMPRWPRYLFVEASNGVAGRYVDYLVSFGGELACVSDKVVSALRAECDATGRIMRHRTLYNIGDILQLVEPSPLAGRSGVVLKLADASLTLAVGSHVVATPYAEVRHA